MKEYKRLTKKSDVIIGGCEYSCPCLHIDTVQRLGQLEDKIETGTLIEEKVCIWGGLNYEEYREAYECSNCKMCFYFEEGGIIDNQFNYCPHCGSKIVALKPLTEEEARKKLKELKGEV